MISVIILTKNEEQNIERCIKSVRWCDEIILIDDNSTDRTIEIAKKYKTLIYLRPLSNNFSAQRNFGISKSKYEWILFLDADEVISDALSYEISNAVGLKDQNLRDFDGFYIKRVYFMWGKKLKYGETGSEWRLRLAKKTAGQWEGKVHEKWKIRGMVGKLVNPIHHFPHQTLGEFLREVNIYTDIRVKELNEENIRVFFWSILAYPLGKFAVNYIFKRGFMDGIHGLIFAAVMTFHSFLVRGKLWLLREKSLRKY